MRTKLIIASLVALSALTASADDILLPVFAYNMPGGQGTAWSSEVYVTNTGTEIATVTAGPFFPGQIDDKPPCQTLLQPFVIVPPRSTVLWRTGEINLGIGCPDFAAGGLLFNSDRPVTLTSRMVRHEIVENGDVTNPLSGLGQEIDGVPLVDLRKGDHRMILAAVGWHPNACGASLLDTNVFLTNPETTPVRVEIDAPPGESQLRIDGTIVDAPFALEVPGQSQRVIRLAGAGSPMLPVCLDPLVGSFTLEASGPISVLGSVIDRRSGDPRTAPAQPIE